MFFSALFRGSVTSWPHLSHFSLKSMPTLSTVNTALPQGCGFFISTRSPALTAKGITPP
jgi:hypothetical protein